MQVFVPKKIPDGGNVVVTILDVEFVVTATGRRVSEEDQVHIWHFNDTGEVTRFRHRADTAKHAAACRA